MDNELIISGLVIGTVVIFQVCKLVGIRKNIEEYVGIFKDKENQLSLSDGAITLKSGAKAYGTFKQILNTLNKYLEKNHNAVADYHLMKDIVDRHCDVKEEEISTQLPFPLYAGLVGTMGGIIVGVWTLSGSLGAVGQDLGPESISPLLESVGIAMTASAAGIIITTLCTSWFKNAQKQVERDKDVFLSWIQAELLPNVGSDFTSAIGRLSGTLSGFNETFGGNTQDIKATLDSAREACKQEAELIEKIDNLNVTKLAKANEKIYEKLQNATDQIGALAANVALVSESLARANEEVKAQTTNSQTMSALLDAWGKEAQNREALINKLTGKLDDLINERIKEIYDNTDKTIKHYNDTFWAAYGKEREHIEEEIAKLPQIVADLHNLRDIKEAVQNLTASTIAHGELMKSLTEAQGARLEASLGDWNSRLNGIISAQNKRLDELSEAIQGIQSIEIPPVKVKVDSPSSLRSQWKEFGWGKWVVMGFAALVPLACLIFIGIVALAFLAKLP